ncbi:MAG: TIGR02444 family protein [Rubrivivax sp.]|nr:TIGR02444 family protein [Rubrivivax sp.]MBK8528498.1 TIGR02444 family protein [Rubrivivax sp.]
MAHAALPARKQNPLWRYSLRVYRLPGVESACLALQDGCGTDTNVLLYCCWLGEGGRSVDKRSLRATMAALKRWQTEVIQPVRQVRRALKSAPLDLPDDTLLDLRRRLAAIELDLEYLEQCRLLEQAQALPVMGRALLPREAMGQNLRRYLELMAIPASAGAWQQVRSLIDACCGAFASR